MDIFSVICEIMPVIIVISGVILCIYHISEKAKHENEQRYIESVEHFYRIVNKCGVSVDEACDACNMLQNKDLNKINSYIKRNGTKWNEL